MKTIRKAIYTGFAAAALASASLPALSQSIFHDIDFEWYLNVGKPLAGPVAPQAYPAPREGYIWSPGHYEGTGARQAWVEAHWITDDYAQQSRPTRPLHHIRHRPDGPSRPRRNDPNGFVRIPGGLAR
jgi:hypothetical protein